MTLFAPEIIKDALISKCGRYRYSLVRRWDTSKERVVFVMINPSTADATYDDPTIRKCMTFARAWGYGGIAVVNLFAYRTPYIIELPTVADPVGPNNDEEIQAWCVGAKMIVAAWGAVPKWAEPRVAVVLKLLDGCPIHCMRTTKDGHPAHPLYLPASLTPIPFAAPSPAAPFPSTEAR